jgi:ubiquinone/menaquinone biosynthesis C-methylase UbiE
MLAAAPGFFSIEMAKIIGTNGKVFAADLQDGMLQKVKEKIKGTEIENRIVLIKCSQEKINAFEKVDFVLCFYMVHEVPGKENFFKELKNLLNVDGQILIVEPSFHVSKKDFERTLNIAKSAGFKTNTAPVMMLNRSCVLTY